MKVLIVDDSATQRLIVKSIVSNFNSKLEPVEMTDAENALNYIKDNEVKLVFSDINMEPFTGIELFNRCKELQQIPEFAFMTSHLTDSMKEQSKELGVKFYITKPITQEKIEEVLKEVFNA